jgi:preprotein translocase subunit YajC
MTNLMITILMAPSGGQQSGQSGYFLIMMLLMIVIFYFFMIRPQVKRQKEMANYRNSLKKGDKVITTGGIYGKVQEINEQTILLEIDNNVTIKVDKNAVLRDPTDLTQK